MSLTSSAGSGGGPIARHSDQIPLIQVEPRRQSRVVSAAPAATRSTPMDNHLQAQQGNVANNNLLSVGSSHLNPLNASFNSQMRRSPKNQSLNGSHAASSHHPISERDEIRMQHHEEAVRAAHAALKEEEVDDEINLTLWEQAAWNAKIYAIVESGSFPSDIPPSVERAAILLAILTAIVILLSCASILALSYPEYVDDAPDAWSSVEVFCVVVFTFDLVIRLMTCPNRTRFAYDFFNWVDVISILPYYVGLFGSDGFPWYLRIIRALRIARLVKVLKSRGILGLKDFLNTLQESFAGVVLFFIVSGTGLLIFSTMMYFSERGVFDDQTFLWWRDCTIYQVCVYPNATQLLLAANGSLANVSIYNSNHTGTEVSPFQSIAGSLWFTIDTMTTTGTGEIEGYTSAGHFVTAMMSFAGIFFIGVPTMILAGNHVAHKVMTTQVVVRNSWADLHRRKRRLMGTVLGSLDVVRRYFGWSTVTDRAWLALQPSEDVAAVPDGGCDITLAIPDNALTPGRVGLGGSAVDSAKTAKQRASVVVGFYRVKDVVREIRMSMVDPNEFLYEPLFVMATDGDGRPRGKVVWAQSGMPTVVQFEIMLEDEETRNAVAKVAGQLNPNARIRCDCQSGLMVKHTSPLDALRTQEVDEDGNEVISTVARWSMLPLRSRPGFRDRSLPIFFKRTGGSWDNPLEHQDDEVRFTEQELINDALASLLGSGLLIECIVPIPPVRRRVMVVTQFLQCSRLHRELELCAHRASRNVPFDQLTAYITDSDFYRLLEGVARRAELVDPSLVVEDLSAVERAMANVILRGLRRTRVVQIPTRFERCLYNSEVLEADDIVYEVPMSIFVGDEDDEVEQDSLGYVELTARASYGRAVRIDFGVSMTSAVACSSAGGDGCLGSPEAFVTAGSAL